MTKACPKWHVFVTRGSIFLLELYCCHILFWCGKHPFLCLIGLGVDLSSKPCFFSFNFLASKRGKITALYGSNQPPLLVIIEACSLGSGLRLSYNCKVGSILVNHLEIQNFRFHLTFLLQFGLELIKNCIYYVYDIFA